MCELVLAQREGSVTRCDSVTTSAGGKATPRRGKEGDDVSWANANLIG
jgi:predicted flavoprotein YhiN